MMHFEGPPNEALPDDERTLSHSELGELNDLFLGIQERHGVHGGRDRSRLPGMNEATLEAVEAGGKRIMEDAVDAMKNAILRRRGEQS